VLFGEPAVDWARVTRPMDADPAFDVSLRARAETRGQSRRRHTVNDQARLAALRPNACHHLNMSSPQNPMPRPDFYTAVAARRLQWDNQVWQVPVLSLTAQAFFVFDFARRCYKSSG
jgi:hypothetical protein